MTSSKNGIEQSTHWFWEYKSGHWASFPEEDQGRLNEKSKKQRTATFPLDVAKTGRLDKVCLDFQSMTVKKAKQIWNACCSVKTDGKFYTWSWEGPAKKKSYFSCPDVLELQCATTAGEKMVHCTIKGVGRVTVDLNCLLMKTDDSAYKVCQEFVPSRKRVAGEGQASDAEDENADGEWSSPKRPKWATAASGLPKAVVQLQRLDHSPLLQKAGTSVDNCDTLKNGHTSSVMLPPVDPECSELKDNAIVYSEGCDIYDAMLNQTNLEFNNNKFIVLQVLKKSKEEAYYAWFHWGRVGKKGQSKLKPCGKDKEQAKALFLNKFKQKTLNDWSNRAKFKKHPGKYDMVKVDYGKMKDEHHKEYEELCRDLDDAPEEEKPCQLTEALQALMTFISSVSDIKVLCASVDEMHYDLVKAPLGKLTDEQIQLGYKALSKIEECIKRGKPGTALVSACNEFYTRIPHDFGMRRPPKITTLDEVSKKVKLLEALSDIQVALELCKKEQQLKACHPLDKLYMSMGCSLTQLQNDDDEYQLISKYVSNTHGSTHQEYNLHIKSVYRISRKCEEDTFRKLPNRALLWHGSRASNWAGILSQGLRVAPPEAPVTGYMFGKGVYFSDCVSKSANYCFPHRYNNKGLLVLSEVSLGNCNQLYSADYNANKLPKDKDSVMGMGLNVPNPEESVMLPDGVLVPCGRLVKNITEGVHYSLQYNEYIVYDARQIKMRYLVWVDFEHKTL